MPLVASTLSLFGHGSARVLKLGRRYGTRLCPGISLATGCHSSPSLARGVMLAPIHQSASCSTASVCVHVDDCSQETSGTFTQVLEQLMLGGDAFVEGSLDAGLTISAKSVVIASNPQLGKELAQHFKRKWGITLALGSVGEHLGLAKTMVRSKQSTAFSILKKK